MKAAATWIGIGFSIFVAIASSIFNYATLIANDKDQDEDIAEIKLTLKENTIMARELGILNNEISNIRRELSSMTGSVGELVRQTAKLSASGERPE